MKLSTRSIVWVVATIIGVGLIIGATRNLPASARGLVTAENDILIDQLTERVGEENLVQAVLRAEIVDENPQLRTIRSRIERRTERRNEQGNVRGNVRGNERRHGQRDRDRALNEDLIDALDDELERIGPQMVYEIAVDAGLLTQAEADSLLEQ